MKLKFMKNSQTKIIWWDEAYSLITNMFSHYYSTRPLPDDPDGPARPGAPVAPSRPGNPCGPVYPVGPDEPVPPAGPGNPPAPGDPGGRKEGY